ncbi:serine/threonine protein phosphatase 2A 55 kDa regulatory subunit B alpha isoform-like [Vicia villosa]|uniref:serine/threonine protein phosphatase 2A 55 kDa regulatory subunit B alpha isoform-like n=1 Tax=Vicia villosa TaxID=3911 RepID=UPI00273C940D|nr:serine/threonine protein phosphatase 2A 55 kDa regulatory subunit B alpha isoform-like [Vicia villosa]
MSMNLMNMLVHALKNIYSISRHPEFRYKTEFQSHEPEFDYLKSLEIEEKINKIRWCQIANGALFLLSTNDKTIKFWKVQEKKVKKIAEMNVDPSLKTMGNGSIASSSNLSNPKPSLENGGYPDSDRSFNYLSSDFSFPPGGIPSLSYIVLFLLVIVLCCLKKKDNGSSRVVKAKGPSGGGVVVVVVVEGQKNRKKSLEVACKNLRKTNWFSLRAVLIISISRIC